MAEDVQRRVPVHLTRGGHGQWTDEGDRGPRDGETASSSAGAPEPAFPENLQLT